MVQSAPFRGLRRDVSTGLRWLESVELEHFSLVGVLNDELALNA